MTADSLPRPACASRGGQGSPAVSEGAAAPCRDAGRDAGLRDPRGAVDVVAGPVAVRDVAASAAAAVEAVDAAAVPLSDRLPRGAVLRRRAARLLPPERLLPALAAVMVLVLAAALVPMVAISPFDHSYADDWHYAVDAHLVLEAGGNWLDALAAALREVADTFRTWQGTYSAILLMALQPGLFGEQFYGLGAVAIMVSLVLATGYFGSVALRDVLRADRASWIIVVAVVLLLQTQLIPSPVEGFWWYNAAVYYTFYHALMLALLGLAVRLARGRTHRGALSGPGMAARVLALVLLAFVIAGGNFVTGLVVTLAFTGLVGAVLMRRPRRAVLLVPALVVLVAGFAVSMAAPGNAERQATQFPEDALGVVETIVRSGFAGVEYSVLWTNGLLVLMLAIALPVLVRVAARSGRSFRLPGLATAGALALFMASFTPTFYSMGSVGPGRVQNIRYDLFVLLVFGCVTWFAGWFAARRAHDGRPLRVLVPGCQVLKPRRFAIYYGSVLTVLVLAVSSLAVDERHRDDLVSISAANALITGVAQEYDEQVWERIERIEASDAADVAVPYITAAPKVLFMGDIRDNMDNYINFRLAQWYGKDSIIAYHAEL